MTTFLQTQSREKLFQNKKKIKAKEKDSIAKQKLFFFFNSKKYQKQKEATDWDIYLQFM